MTNSEQLKMKHQRQLQNNTGQGRGHSQKYGQRQYCCCLVHATPFCTKHSLHVLFERESDIPPSSWEDPQHIMWLHVCTF